MTSRFNSNSRTVYTTESGRICPDCGRPIAACTCKKKSRSQGEPTRSSVAASLPKDGVVRVVLEKKGRGGKTVSIVAGLRLNDEDLRELSTELKRRCGTGGTVKDGLIEIQGDHRDVLMSVLKDKGYTVKRVGG